MQLADGGGQPLQKIRKKSICGDVQIVYVERITSKIGEDACDDVSPVPGLLFNYDRLSINVASAVLKKVIDF